MTPDQAAARLNRIANSLDRQCTRALNLSAQQGVQMGRDLSSGGYSTDALADMGHPYAVRHEQTAARLGMSRREYLRKSIGVSSVLAAYIVNKQSGEFQSAWKTRPPSSAFNGALRTAVVNDSRVAGFLAGKNRPKSRMVRRPIDSKIVELLQPIAVENVREAVRRALKTK